MFEAMRATLLASGLVFPGLAAYTAVYVTLALMLAMGAKVRADHLRSLVALSVFVAVGALLLSILLNGGAGDDWTALLMVLPFLAVPLAGSGLAVAPRQFATFCLIGALAALAVGLVESFVLGVYRAGGGNNPIHFASLAGMLGMASLIGAAGHSDRLRFIFLAGPAAAIAVALLSGSRGVLLADAVMIAIALVAFWRDRWFLLALLAFPLAGFAAIVALGEGDRALLLFSGMLQTDSKRLMMAQAAGQMFLSSPIWGHGFGSFMEIAGTLYPDIASAPNLHSDISNLAAVGGVLGLIAYAGLIGAPLMALLNPQARKNPAIVLLALLVSGGNAALGLTNAIIGLLPQMTLLVLMTAYVLALERQAALGARTFD